MPEVDVLRQFTIGYDPKMGVLMFEGKAGDAGATGQIERLYLFGGAEIPPGTVNDAYFRQTADLGDGQQRQEHHGMPSFQIRINGKQAGRFSREVVSACSHGVDPARVAAFAEALKKALTEEIGDLAVTMNEVLSRPPALGFLVSPPIRFSDDDDLSVRDLLPGYRLFMVGRILGGRGAR